MFLFIYTVPYFDKEKNTTHIASFHSDELLMLIPCLNQFLDYVSHGYLDEDYNSYSDIETLKIAVEEYSIGEILVQEIVSQDLVDHSSFYVRDLYYQLTYYQDMFHYIKSTNEILLSTEISYSHDVYEDDINILVNGHETSLFSMDYISEDDTEEDYVLPATEKEKHYRYKYFETGIELPDFFVITHPLKSKEEIVSVFIEWAKKHNLDLSGKTIRMAKEEEFLSRPLLDKLIQQEEANPDFEFVIPGHLAFFLHDEVPSPEKLIELLKDQPAKVIACVIDGFKDETIVTVLNALADKKEEILKVYPLMPTLETHELKRFARLFGYSKDFILERIQELTKRYGGNIIHLQNKEYKTELEERDWNEFSVWRDLLSN